MLELILLIITSIITARFLEKRYKIASAFHAILFIVQAALLLFTTDIPFIREVMINWMGEAGYSVVCGVLSVPGACIYGGISVVLLLELSILVFLPLLSVVVFINEIRETFKEMKVKFSIKNAFTFIINLVLDPVKDFKHNKNETYLILGKLLN